ncbi:HAMP domain-containing sensor histidine kinase [Lichenifustis flavocetrariae]|uniref:histidine kinase n=1 Tax=Lichenifustis flavocetrariae TaxID=2949735 RepID=A0AA42CRM5_9HYPH|nr:HAMP domain-containing sensor histidine kinase [Lichenifustis flavocetrariae]MCW6512647.1 HAMP domain-containing histidine kinase [Lichenifustis flavocetrariae]
MRRGALKLRLLAGGAVSIVVVFTVFGVGLYFLFERHVERRVALELGLHLRQLVSGIERGPTGALQLARPLAEPRFAEPLSGLYWQVSPEPSGAVLRSRSLWDAALTLPADRIADGAVHQYVIPGPGGASLFAVERVVGLPKAMGGGDVRAVVAIDRTELTTAARDFLTDLLPFLCALGAVLLGAGWLQVTIGLRPLDAVRSRLADVRGGRRTQLGAEFPDEVLPLAAEVDLLLLAQEGAITKARARAADLAHALRTPLAVLQGDAEALRVRGEHQVADEIAGVADSMRRTVERELAQARAGTRVSRGMAEPLLPMVQSIVGVLSRLPAGRSLDFAIEIAPELHADVDPQDLSEVIGCLGENATKWARGRVTFSARAEGEALSIAVEDDGPGISVDRREMALSRGGRLPQAKPGSGLGLAIVDDLCEAYGGMITLETGTWGGLRAEVRLPAAKELRERKGPPYTRRAAGDGIAGGHHDSPPRRNMTEPADLNHQGQE